MNCLDCHQAARTSIAVGICHHCSAAVCDDHAMISSVPITRTEAMGRRVTLPHAARLLLCPTCSAAFTPRTG